MTIPRQTADTKISHPAPSDSASQVAIDDAHSNYGTTHSLAGDSSIALDVFESPVLPPLDPAYLASREKLAPPSSSSTSRRATPLLWPRCGMKITFPSKVNCSATYIPIRILRCFNNCSSAWFGEPDFSATKLATQKPGSPDPPISKPGAWFLQLTKTR